MVHINQFDFIDLTHTISVHQGYETSGSKRYLVEDDFYWNRKFLKTEIENKTWLLFNKLVCLCPFLLDHSVYAFMLSFESPFSGHILVGSRSLCVNKFTSFKKRLTITTHTVANIESIYSQLYFVTTQFLFFINVTSDYLFCNIVSLFYYSTHHLQNILGYCTLRLVFRSFVTIYTPIPSVYFKRNSVCILYKRSELYHVWVPKCGFKRIKSV